MDNFQKFIKQVRWRLFLIGAAGNLLIVACWWVGDNLLGLDTAKLAIALAVVTLAVATATALIVGGYLMSPLKTIWQAIIHITPEGANMPPPKIDSLRLGRELVASLTTQIYQLGSAAASADGVASQKAGFHTDFIAKNLPLPLFVLDDDKNIVFANQTAATYLNLKLEDIEGQSAYTVLDMSFTSEDTLEAWLTSVEQHTATASKSWEHVRIGPRDSRPTQLFDLAAYYNQGNLHGWATILVLFDHTTMYSQDDQATSYVALAVHELRTPLTLLRGYIEVFEEEFAGKLSPELEGFMAKMQASAQQLATFVNNILNVARIDDDQMELQLHEHDWNTILTTTIKDLSLRARIRGISLECSIAPDLPAVGIDRISIYEVISNLIDNAIKYSGNSNRIVISSQLNNEGLVETNIQDFGVGIPESIMPHLFTKFYRNHRNRAQIGGTGLGLYLSRAIITAHGGNIWVRSKEGEGSTFSFTILPYAKLKETDKGNNQNITRGAHGWIKNHSFYRR